MTKIIDNFLGKDLIEYLEHYFLYNIPHYLTGFSANKNEKKFYNSPLNPNDLMMSFLIKKLKNEFNFKQVISIYLNIQHYKMNGSWHYDEGVNTIILMVSKTLKKNSGEFQIKEKNKIVKFKFVQNKVIYFNAKKIHRGLGPSEFDTPRITLALKTI